MSAGDSDRAGLARTRRVADRWLEPFLAGERAPADVYAASVVTWHAATDTETVVSEPPSFARLRAVVPDLRREDVRVEIFAGGIVVQATTVGTVDGTEVRVPVCLIVRLDDAGHIRRFEEYADSARAEPLVRKLAEGRGGEATETP